MKTAISMKTVGVMVGITLALAALYMFLYIPESKRLDRLRNDHSALKEELAAAKQKISLRPNVDEDIEGVKKSIAELEARTVRKDEISSAIEAFETEAYRLGMSKGVLIKVIDSEDEEAAEADGGGESEAENEESLDSIRNLRFSIVLRCSYGRLLQYVSSLGGLPMLVTVDSVAVRKVEEAETGLHAELEVRTYSLR